jgi:pimeloyl-ACP methyl ester carboxylesterase
VQRPHLRPNPSDSVAGDSHPAPPRERPHVRASAEWVHAEGNSQDLTASGLRESMPAMPKASSNGIQLEFETFGNASDRPVLLIMGLGGQMILWDEAFCQQLADRGHYVIRYDNRDVGLSTKFEEHGTPNALAMMMEAAQGKPIEVPYTLEDMADDAVGLLDALAIERAHVVGASMGGMIAQVVAIRHTSRVRSLTSIMSTTANRDLPPPSAEATAKLMREPATDRESYIDGVVETFQVIGSPGFTMDIERSRERAGRAYDRCFLPSGQTRQLAAILAAENRVPALQQLELPTLVIHGAADPLVPVEGGRDTAQAVPGAEWLCIDGMGHDLPVDLHGKIVDSISALTGRADGI